MCYLWLGVEDEGGGDFCGWEVGVIVYTGRREVVGVALSRKRREGIGLGRAFRLQSADG